ncbi:MAG TPA: GNAT family N-acetyltransferase [Candidatus Angelobacter sp.]|jgi:GNAT superfamily N-acetyltransferase|nr:GNAT family N-acetyltransferase [Candidatus Angelobacter sp.]
MSGMLYRQARRSDIPAMAEIRAADWGTEEYWRVRILAYLMHELHPKGALPPRISYVCVESGNVVGLIAGHLTRRFGCDGELEWISIRPPYRGRGIAFELLRRLSMWFVKHNAMRICVDVEPSNELARRFYNRHGADDLKPHWMIWKDIRQLVEVQRSLG